MEKCSKKMRNLRFLLARPALVQLPRTTQARMTRYDSIDETA
jgi:hypothetical protein